MSIQVDANFPAGNIILERIEGSNIFVRQDLRDTEGDWFYWYFRLRGAAGQRVQVHFTDSDVIGVRGPGVSLDGGNNWYWLGKDAVQDQGFTYQVPDHTDEVRFSFGMPYTQINWDAFIRKYRQSHSHWLQESVLCSSKSGRSVEHLRVGNLSDKVNYYILLAVRHHCCEMMASYALEGIIATILADNETGSWLRENVQFEIVPFVDKDGVEEGDQGKNRIPHDHNRDYVAGIYPETVAVRQLAAKLPRVDLALDLHCPWIRGDNNEWTYFVGGPEDGNWQRVGVFCQILERAIRGTIPYRRENNLPWGQDWNTGDHRQKTFSGWAASLPGIKIATTLELPYANALGAEVNPDSARALGRDLARTISTYLQETATILDEKVVPEYSLPELLTCLDGSVVSEPDDWWQKRRPEILAQLSSEMFGQTPTDLPDIQFELQSISAKAMNGLATRKIVRAHYGIQSFFDILIYQPNHKQTPYAIFLGLNFQGNHTISTDPEVPISNSWVPNAYPGVTNHRSSEASRGTAAPRWPVKMIVERGYALATIYCGDIDPDFDDGFENGVHALFPRSGRDAWGTIGAWAWGLSRALDYILPDSDLDSNRVAVFGHSRLGKAALWAGAQDQRFAMVISNDSGCGGAALSQRRFGETVLAINSSFPHWFCQNFRAYNHNESVLPFDQHHLLALIAPRPLYVASASEDLWADPRGEFLAAVEAGKVYRLLGKVGLPVAEMPTPETPIMGGIAYHRRSGQHNITPYDWQCYLDFADLNMK